MNNGYRELVLTLQNIMYSDSELEYIAKERNVTQFRIERLCSLTTKEISQEPAYRNCILIKKSTVDYFDKLGYNLFRQFETSYDEEYYRRPLWKSDDEAYEIYKLITVLKYSLSIYYFTVLPPTTRRRFPAVSSTIYVNTHSNISNPSQSTVESPLARNLNGSDVSQPSSVSGSFSDYMNESIWGSTSRLPTALLEPISNWDSFSSEDLTSSDSDDAREPGGIFVKLATLNSTSRSSSIYRGSRSDEITAEEITDSPNLKVVNDQESNNSTESGDNVPMRNGRPGTSGEGLVSSKNDKSGVPGGSIVPRNADPEMSDESTISRRNADPEMSDESTMSRRNANPGMSREGIVFRRNSNPGMSDESTVSRRNANPRMSGEGIVSRRLLGRNSDPGMSDESKVSRRNVNPVISGEVAPNFNPTTSGEDYVGNFVTEEYKNFGEGDESLEKNFKESYDDIQLNSRRDSGMSVRIKDKLKRRMNVNKRAASSLSVSPESSLGFSKEPKQSKLFSDATEFSPSHLSISENIKHSINNFKPQESTIEEVEDNFDEFKIGFPPSSLISNTIDESIFNTHVKRVTNVNNEHSFGDKSDQKECSEDKSGQNVLSMVMSSSSNNSHTTIQHSDPMTVIKLENPSELSNDPQHTSFIDIQQHKESHDHMQPFDTLQESRNPCENRSHLDKIENEIVIAPVHYSNDGIFSQNGATTATINQPTSFDQIQSIRHNRASELNDINEDLRFYNSPRATDDHFPFDNIENSILSMARIERQVAFYSFINQNRITESLQYPDNDPGQLTEASISNLNPQNHACLPPLNVPLLWSRKCANLQYLLSLKLSQPHRYIQEYNRIRKSRLNIINCFRKRETSGSLHQTKVLEAIAQPHYNIYPPADEQEIRKLLEDVHGEDEMDLCGYLMVSLATIRTFYPFPAN